MHSTLRAAPGSSISWLHQVVHGGVGSFFASLTRTCIRMHTCMPPPPTQCNEHRCPPSTQGCWTITGPNGTLRPPAAAAAAPRGAPAVASLSLGGRHLVGCHRPARRLSVLLDAPGSWWQGPPAWMAPLEKENTRVQQPHTLKLKQKASYSRNIRGILCSESSSLRPLLRPRGLTQVRKRAFIGIQRQGMIRL